MVLRQRQTSRWIRPLVNVIFLQCVAASASHAVESNDIAATNIVSTDTAPTETDNTELSQLNLDSYNSDDEAGLDLYLDVTLNGASAGLTHFYYRDDELWASTQILQKLGFIIEHERAGHANNSIGCYLIKNF